MSKVITITGQTLAAGSAQTLDLSALYLAPIKSILKAELMVEAHDHVFAGTPATPTGTVAAPVFSGNVLATHQHDITCAGSAAAAGTDALSIKATVLNYENAAGSTCTDAVDAKTGGTPAGTNTAPAFTGVQATPAGVNADGQAARTELTIVTATPTGVEEIQRLGNASVSMWLTDALTVDDMLFLTVEERGEIVRP